MKEFMFFILKQNNSSQTLSAEKHQQFLKACERYIGDLKQKKLLLSAQPIDWAGKVISGNANSWKENEFDVPMGVGSGEVIGGYYHILAKDLEEAIQIAKANPEFQFNEGTRIEVRPIKMKESTTEFVYPAHGQ